MIDREDGGALKCYRWPAIFTVWSDLSSPISLSHIFGERGLELTVSRSDPSHFTEEKTNVSCVSRN
jgi:hypothetical protein